MFRNNVPKEDLSYLLHKDIYNAHAMNTKNIF